MSRSAALPVDCDEGDKIAAILQYVQLIPIILSKIDILEKDIAVLKKATGIPSESPGAGVAEDNVTTEFGCTEPDVVAVRGSNGAYPKRRCRKTERHHASGLKPDDSCSSSDNDYTHKIQDNFLYLVNNIDLSGSDLADQIFQNGVISMSDWEAVDHIGKSKSKKEQNRLFWEKMYRYGPKKFATLMDIMSADKFHNHIPEMLLWNSNACNSVKKSSCLCCFIIKKVNILDILDDLFQFKTICFSERNNINEQTSNDAKWKLLFKFVNKKTSDKGLSQLVKVLSVKYEYISCMLSEIDKKELICNCNKKPLKSVQLEIPNGLYNVQSEIPNELYNVQSEIHNGLYNVQSEIPKGLYNVQSEISIGQYNIRQTAADFKMLNRKIGPENTILDVNDGIDRTNCVKSNEQERSCLPFKKTEHSLIAVNIRNVASRKRKRTRNKSIALTNGFVEVSEEEIIRHLRDYMFCLTTIPGRSHCGSIEQLNANKSLCLELDKMIWDADATTFEQETNERLGHPSADVRSNVLIHKIIYKVFKSSTARFDEEDCLAWSEDILRLLPFAECRDSLFVSFVSIIAMAYRQIRFFGLLEKCISEGSQAMINLIPGKEQGHILFQRALYLIHSFTGASVSAKGSKVQLDIAASFDDAKANYIHEVETGYDCTNELRAIYLHKALFQLKTCPVQHFGSHSCPVTADILAAKDLTEYVQSELNIEDAPDRLLLLYHIVKADLYVRLENDPSVTSTASESFIDQATGHLQAGIVMVSNNINLVRESSWLSIRSYLL